MVHRLEIPLELAGVSVNGNDRVAKQVVSRSISSVIVGRRTADGHEERAGLGVNRHVPTPDVGAGAALPTVVEPSIVADFSRLRNSVKRPDGLAGERIISARIARRADGQLAYTCAQEHEIFEDCGDTVVANFQIDNAVPSESWDDLAGCGIERHQLAVECGENDARSSISVTRPIGDAARRRHLYIVVP